MTFTSSLPSYFFEAQITHRAGIDFQSFERCKESRYDIDCLRFLDFVSLCAVRLQFQRVGGILRVSSVTAFACRGPTFDRKSAPTRYTELTSFHSSNFSSKHKTCSVVEASKAKAKLDAHTKTSGAVECAHRRLLSYYRSVVFGPVYDLNQAGLCLRKIVASCLERLLS